jgi:hypothetical protein
VLCYQGLTSATPGLLKPLRRQSRVAREYIQGLIRNAGRRELSKKELWRDFDATPRCPADQQIGSHQNAILLVHFKQQTKPGQSFSMSSINLPQAYGLHH